MEGPASSSLERSGLEVLSGFERLPDEILLRILEFFLHRASEKPSSEPCLRSPLQQAGVAFNDAEREGFRTLAILSLCSSRLRKVFQPRLFAHVYVPEPRTFEGEVSPRSRTMDWLDPEPFRGTISLHLYYHPQVILPTLEQMPNLRQLHLDCRMNYQLIPDLPTMREDALQLARCLSALSPLQILQLDYFRATFLRVLLGHCQSVDTLVLGIHPSIPVTDAGEHDLEVVGKMRVGSLTLRASGVDPGDVLIVLSAIDTRQVETLSYAVHVDQPSNWPRWLHDRRWPSLRQLCIQLIIKSSDEMPDPVSSFVHESLEDVAFFSLPPCNKPTEQQEVIPQCELLSSAITRLFALAPNLKRFRIMPVPYSETPVLALYHLAITGAITAQEVVLAFDTNALTSTTPHALGSRSDRCGFCKSLGEEIWQDIVAQLEALRAQDEHAKERGQDAASQKNLELALSYMVHKLREILKTSGKRLLCGGLPPAGGTAS